MWFLLFFLMSAAFVAVALRRVMLLARRLRDPESLRELLSPEVLAALDQAGIRLDGDGMARLGKSEELGRLVTADLRRAFGRAILAPTSAGPTRTIAPAAAAISGASSLGAFSGSASGRSELPVLPPPIDAVASSRTRVAVFVAVAAAIASAVVWLLELG